MVFSAGIIVLIVFMGAAVVPCVYLCACNLTLIVGFVLRVLYRDKEHFRETEKERDQRETIKIKKQKKRQKEKAKKKQVQEVDYGPREMDEYIDEYEEEELNEGEQEEEEESEQTENNKDVEKGKK